MIRDIHQAPTYNLYATFISLLGSYCRYNCIDSSEVKIEIVICELPNYKSTDKTILPNMLNTLVKVALRPGPHGPPSVMILDIYKCR